MSEIISTSAVRCRQCGRSITPGNPYYYLDGKTMCGYCFDRYRPTYSSTPLPTLSQHCQRLERAARAVINYRDSAGALGFQLEKLDDHLDELRRALEMIHT